MRKVWCLQQTPDELYLHKLASLNHTQIPMKSSSLSSKLLLSNLSFTPSTPPLPPLDKLTYKDFTPCTHCLGFVQKHQLWQHNKTCPYRENESKFGRLQHESEILLFCYMDRWRVSRMTMPTWKIMYYILWYEMI